MEGAAAEPTVQRFRENLELITRRLRQETDARIALSSLAPVGEDPHSDDPVQSRLNDLCAAYNDVIREVSSREGADYIDFYEAFREQLDRSTTAKPFTRFSFPSFYRDYLVREMVLRRSFDEISLNQRVGVSHRRHSSQYPRRPNSDRRRSAVPGLAVSLAVRTMRRRIGRCVTRPAKRCWRCIGGGVRSSIPGSAGTATPTCWGPRQTSSCLPTPMRSAGGRRFRTWPWSTGPPR